MREIKFRAWDIKGQGFVNGFNMIGFSLGQGAPKPKLQRFDTEWDINDIILEQYTGLKDKNGKEIYEGDIIVGDFNTIVRPFWKDLKHKKEIDESADKQSEEIIKKNGIVRYSHGYFELGFHSLGSFLCGYDNNSITLKEYNKVGENHCSRWSERWWNFEIIGNIHDNPELLSDNDD